MTNVLPFYTLEEKMRKICILLALLSAPALVSAQSIRAEPSQVSIGAGSMLGDEGTTFSWEGFFGAIHWHGVEIMNRQITSGVGIEIHPAAVFSFTENNISIQQVDAVDFRVWSLNRLNMSVFQLPGDVWEELYIGSDFLIVEGGSTDFTGDFTARFVFGASEKAGPGWLDLEIYMFEKYRPISFSILYRYNF